MDYSASINDTEAAGSSPWGNSPSSSPRPTRSTFASTIIPDDYVPPAANNGLNDEDGFGAGDNGFQRHDTTDAPGSQSGALFSDDVPASQPQQENQASYSAEVSQGEVHPQSQTESHQEPQHEYGQHQQSPQQQQQQHPQYPPHQQQQQQQQYQQYQQQPPPQQQQQYSPDQRVQQQFRRPQPQFKLQAKITGLERTGRKDPILRFDVHVCYKEPMRLICANLRYRPTFPVSVRPSTAMYAAYTPNSSSSLSTSYPQTPKPSCLLCHQRLPLLVPEPTRMRLASRL